MINKHKGGSIISDIKNMQNELAYTTDDTYLFNYKNKQQELDKLLYKLSKYEKACKKRKQKKKIDKKKLSIKKQDPIKKQDSIKKQDLIKKNIKSIKKNKKTKKQKTKKQKTKKQKTKKKKEKKNIKGGKIDGSIPKLLYVPVIGSILFEKNKIKFENNSNLIEDLLLFIVNHLINIVELASIIYVFLNSNKLNGEDLIVISIILGIRIISNIFIYKKENIEKNDNYNKTVHKFIVMVLMGLPLFIMLYNSEHYELMDNILLTFLLTILCVPYFRLLYNKINKNNFDWQNGLWINIVEKIICGIIIYIIIKNNFEINAIFDFIKNINSDVKLENKEIKNKEIENKEIENKEIENKEIENKEIENIEESSENVLLNNFNNLFKKKYI